MSPLRGRPPTSNMGATDKNVGEGHLAGDLLQVHLELPLPVLVPHQLEEVRRHVAVADGQEMLGPLAGHTLHQGVHHDREATGLSLDVAWEEDEQDGRRRHLPA